MSTRMTNKPVSRLIHILFLLVTLLIAMALNTHANDSWARVGAGGLTLLKNEDIRMAKELLEISEERIRVTYSFINESGHDIVTTVAFPLPEFKSEDDDDFLLLANNKKEELIAKKRALYQFKTWSNGQPIRTKTFRKKTKDNGKNSSEWAVSETIYWTQRFPKGKPVEIVHEYEPRYGQAFNTTPEKRSFYRDIKKNGFLNAVLFRLSDPLPDPLVPIADNDPFAACIDNKTKKAIVAKLKFLQKRKSTGIMVYRRDVEYILGTGRNWKGSIADFTLRITKNSPDDIIALCFPGTATRIDAKTIEYRHTNFVPQDKLAVYFISVHGETP